MGTGPVPGIGQDNDDIYRRELGLGDEELVALRVEGSATHEQPEV